MGLGPTGDTVGVRGVAVKAECKVSSLFDPVEQDSPRTRPPRRQKNPTSSRGRSGSLFGLKGGPRIPVSPGGRDPPAASGLHTPALAPPLSAGQFAIASRVAMMHAPGWHDGLIMHCHR